MNIIHRDLKVYYNYLAFVKLIYITLYFIEIQPENLLINKVGNIKLCDFGWSADILNL
jgi:serine/threonine protein kinase